MTPQAAGRCKSAPTTCQEASPLQARNQRTRLPFQHVHVYFWLVLLLPCYLILLTCSCVARSRTPLPRPLRICAYSYSGRGRNSDRLIEMGGAKPDTCGTCCRLAYTYMYGLRALYCSLSCDFSRALHHLQTIFVSLST